MVHDLKPPFLDGNTVYTTQASQIQVVKDPLADMAILAKKGSAVVKDPNSDMALLAKKGSAVVKELRERNERTRIAKKEEKAN